MDTRIRQQITDIVGAAQVAFDVPMAAHTTFKVGGPADILVTPADEQALIAALKFCRRENVPYLIVGNGSNLLVGDKGIRGVVFRLCHTMADIEFTPCDETHVLVRAGAGISLPKLSREAAARGLTGLEFASGIPGTFGGALVMNAGAYGGEMKQCVRSVKVLDTKGQVQVRFPQTLMMGYRTSAMQKNNDVVLEATLLLTAGDRTAIEVQMETLLEKRSAKQPLEWPSAGSTFKRPQGYFAGKLLEDAGLRGYRVGGACVSEKHCGFVINDRGATAAEILRLIRDIQRIVRERSGVTLEPEVRIVGEF